MTERLAYADRSIMSVRKKYDYHVILSYYGLEKSFDLYFKKHNKISFNRAARAFLTSKKVFYKSSIFEKGNKEGPDSHFIKLAKDHSWIES